MAGLTRAALRPVADRWPHTPRGLATVDRIAARAGRAAGRLHGRRTREHFRTTTIAGIPALIVRAPAIEAPERTVLHFHGGGFVFGNPDMYRDFALRLSVAARAEVVLFDYRHPPHADVDHMSADCLNVYRWALEHTAPQRLVTSGDSAGGNLMFGTLATARDAGLAMPSAALAQSAWLDLTHRHPRRAPIDAFFSLRFAGRSVRLLRTEEQLPAQVRPLELDLRGLPPVLLQVGAEEPLREANMQMANRLGAQGVSAELQLWRRQVHVFQAFAAMLPEARAAFAETTVFLNNLAGASAPSTRRSLS